MTGWRLGRRRRRLPGQAFAFDEFSARVRALLRRGSDTKSAVLSLEDLTLNTTNRKVTRAGQDISLTSTEYALLEYLLRNQGQVLTRSQIADHVWNYDFSYDSNVGGMCTSGICGIKLTVPSPPN